MHTYKKGDRVYWTDPDEGLCSGSGTVIKVPDQDNDTVITVTGDDSSEIGALAKELRLLRTAKTYMVVEATFDPDITNADDLADALDILMDTARSPAGVLDKHGDPRIGGFYPVDPDDIKRLRCMADSLPIGRDRDAMANILHRLGAIDIPDLPVQADTPRPSSL